MAWQPGFGVRAGLPAGLLGRVSAGQRSLIPAPAADKGQRALGRVLPSEPHEISCNCVFMCL